MTNQELFIEKWETYLENIGQDEVDRLLEQTSPQHPNTNMLWLYDRLLMKKATG